MDVRTVWSRPRETEAVRFPTDGEHGYFDDASFLVDVARWIVTSGGECTLRYLGEQPDRGGDAGETEPHIELLIPWEPDDGEEGPCEIALEPGWWVIHFGYGNFVFLDPESFDDQFSLDASAAVWTIEDGLLPEQPSPDFDAGAAVDAERGAPYLQDVPLHAGDTVGVEVDGEVHLTTFDPAAAVDSDRATPDDTHGWTPGGDQ